MAIVTSVVQSDIEQADGRRAITECHTDQFGKTYLRQYLASADTDPQTLLADHAANVEQQLAQGEITNNVVQAQNYGAKGAFLSDYSNLSDSYAAIVEDFQFVATSGAKALEAELLMGLSDADLANAFGGIDASTVAGIRTGVLQPLANAVAAVRAVEGL